MTSNGKSVIRAVALIATPSTKHRDALHLASKHPREAFVKMGATIIVVPVAVFVGFLLLTFLCFISKYYEHLPTSNKLFALGIFIVGFVHFLGKEERTSGHKKVAKSDANRDPRRESRD
jgi:hypothetical protein